jgi:hypothetical protein
VQCWALSWRLLSLLPLGLKDQAIAAQVTEVMLALEALLNRNPDAPLKLVRADLLLGYGVLAQARWRRGEIHLALQAAEKGSAVSAGCEPISHYVLEGYGGLLEVYTGLWEAGREFTDTGTDLAERCAPLCRSLWQFARMHPVGEPQAWLWTGRCAWLSGKSRRAGRCWRKALAAALRLGMPYDEGLTQYEIGRHARPDAPARREHLSRARDIFARLGAAYDLARVERELSAI